MEIDCENKKKGVLFFLNKDFYCLEEVRLTLNDFKSVCSGKIEESKNEIKIFLFPKYDVDIIHLRNEFCNYVLGLMKNNLKV